MRKNLLVWGLALLLTAGALYTIYTKNNPETAKEKSAESQFITVDLKLEDGKIISEKLKGKKVFLNFWATWCPPCRAEMPDIQKVYDSNTDPDFVILAVNLGEDRNTVRDFLRKNSYTFPIMLDEGDTLGRKFNITSIPTSYFIDRDGKIVKKIMGAMKYEDMQKYIKSLE